VNGVRLLEGLKAGWAITSRELYDLGGGFTPQRALNRRLNARSGWFVEAAL
jgi:hypothetical protein